MVCRDYEVRPGTHQTGEPTFILRSAAVFAHFINAQADGYPRIIRDANMKVEREASEKSKVTHSLSSDASMPSLC
jgi:hypothetical protein